MLTYAHAATSVLDMLKFEENSILYTSYDPCPYESMYKLISLIIRNRMSGRLCVIRAGNRVCYELYSEPPHIGGTFCQAKSSPIRGSAR